jgi:hypothetical protein
MWNMGTDPPYIPAKFGDDIFKPEKVVHEKPEKSWRKNNKNKKNKKTDELLQEQKNIHIHVDVLIIRILMKPYKNKRTFPLHGDVLIKRQMKQHKNKRTSTYMWMS